MTKRRKKLVPLVKPKPARKPGRVIKVINGLVVTVIPTVLAYLGAIALWPRISVDVKEPLDKRDALSAPFEVSNTGIFDFKNLEFEWETRSAGNSQLNHQFNNIKVINPSQKIPLLKANEHAPLFSVVPKITHADVDNADLIVSVRYQPRWIPLNFSQRFRFVTRKTSEGEVRWYPRTVD